MRKSGVVRLSLVHAISIAALAAGCGDPEPTHVQTCVDNNKVVVAEQRCDEEDKRPRTAGYVPFYRWYYYPHSYGQPIVGGRAPEVGSFSRPSMPSAHVARPSVVRGGFGSIGHGIGG